MKPVSLPLARLLAHGTLLLGLVMSAGCGGGSTPPPVETGLDLPDAARSSVEVSRAQGAHANGAEAVEVKVTLRTAAGTALPGLAVTVSVAGEGASVQQPVGGTDAQGVATARVTATVAGTKTVTASVATASGPVVLAAHPTIGFVALPASRLAFASAPYGAVAGAALAEVSVHLQDADGRTVTDASGSVTLALGSGPAGATLSGTLTAEAVQGVAHFGGLRLERAAEGYTLLASAAGLTGATSEAFAVAPGALASLELTATPAQVQAGTPVDLDVTARDAFGNRVTDYRGTVTFNSGSASTLPADYTFVASDLGHHTFPAGAVPTRAGTGAVQVADRDASPTVQASAQLSVSPAPAQRLAFAAAPGGHSVREPFALQVRVLDAYGNVVTGSSAPVSLALDPAGSLSGTTTVSAADGVASFAGLSIAQERVGWVLSASSAGLEPGLSQPFTITDDVSPTPPTLTLAQQGTTTSLTVGWTAVGDDGAEGTAAQQELRYSLRDITSDADFAAATPVALGAPKASGSTEYATLTGLTPHTTYYVALQVTDDAGNRVRSATLPASTAFPTAAKLAFLDEPAGGTAGVALPGLRVAVQDEDGLLVDQADSAITLSVEGVSGYGPWTVQASGGVATFAGVRIDRAGAGYRLVARSGSLADATSQRFAIGHAPASRLLLSGLAPSVVAGAAQSVSVTVKDAFDNTVLDATDTLTLGSSDAAATLPSAHTLTPAAQGQHTFAGIIFATAGTQSLTASAPGLTASTLDTEVDDTAPRALVLSGLPPQVTAGVPVTVTLEAHDSAGRLATGYRGSVHFSADDARAGLPADYTFTAADAGRHSFTVGFQSAGPRTVTVVDTASSSLTTSAGAGVHWAALAALVLEVPGTAAAGNPISVSVHARDAFGNAVKDYAGTLRFSVTDAQATLPADYTFVPADEGSHLFSVTLKRAGSTTLAVADLAAGLGDTAAVAVDAGSASELLLAMADGPFTAGTQLSLTLTARDAWGNPAAGYTGSVHFSASDAQATLPADATFTAGDAGPLPLGATLRTAGLQQLAAEDVSQPFLRAELQREVVPAAPSKLRFVSGPASGTVRASLAPVTVAVADRFDNLVAVSAPAITLGLAGGNPAASLAGTLSASPTDGLATFTGLSLDQQGTGFQLHALADALDDATSAPFDIVDDLAPGAVSLGVTQARSTRLVLSWLAVGDDGSAGQAAAQELRYSTSALSAETFASGQPVTLGAPAASGASESVTVSGLSPSTPYFFALRVSDDAGNARYAFLEAATTADPCAGFTCTPSPAACAADGTTRLTFTAACVDVDGAATCQEQSTPTACPGADAVCYQGACDTAPSPAASELAISELMHSPSAGTTEYVELTNTTSHLLDLDGLTLAYAGAGTPGSFTVGSGVPVLVAPGGRFVLAQNAESATNGGVAADVAYADSFALAGEGSLSVTLGATTVDSLGYTAAFPQAPGHAMSLAASIVGTSASAQPWYWCDASSTLSGGDQGTPGAANDSCGVAVQAPVDYCVIQFPKFFSASVAPGSSSPVYGQFYEPGATDLNRSGNDLYPHVFAELGYGTSAADVASWTWSAAPLDAGYSGGGNNDEVLGTLSIPTAGSYLYGFRYQVRDPATGALSAFTYCDQNGAVTPPAGSYGTVTVATPAPPGTANHVVISEISGGNGSGTAATDEFIELYNPTDFPVNLDGWTVQYKSATGTSYSGTVTINATTAPNRIIPAHGYFLLGGANYSGAAAKDVSYAFDLSASTTAGGHVRIGPGLVATDLNDVNTVDKIAWGTGNSPEGSAAPSHPAIGGSLERKAVAASTPATLAAGGSDAARGNGYDTNNNLADVVTRTARNPQNSASPIELP